MNAAEPPVALTIAGSDSSGGAGLQADLRTFAAFEVHAATALTLVSAQNTAEFRSAVPMPPGMVLSQVEAVLSDLDVVAVKTGLLFTEANINAVATIADHGRLPNLVVDPVLVGMTARPLYDAATEALVAERLLPAALVATPNHLEAGRLLGRPVSDDLDDVTAAATELADLGPSAVVVTGGRAGGELAVDVVVVDGRLRTLEAPRLDTQNVRGSGDTLSAAITAGLARGFELDEAIDLAHRFTSAAIAASASWRLGAGQGPLGHWAAEAPGR